MKHSQHHSSGMSSITFNLTCALMLMSTICLLLLYWGRSPRYPPPQRQYTPVEKAIQRLYDIEAALNNFSHRTHIEKIADKICIGPIPGAEGYTFSLNREDNHIHIIAHGSNEKSYVIEKIGSEPSTLSELVKITENNGKKFYEVKGVGHEFDHLKPRNQN